MARGRLLNEQGQKTTAVEIVDLTSEDDSDPPNLSPLHHGADEDAPIVGSEDDDQTGEDQWESRSLFEDALEELEDERLIDMGEQIKHSRRVRACLLTVLWAFPVEDSCTLEEALAFRKSLRLVGEDRFITDTIEAETITAKKLCTAFGIRPPAFLEGAPDTAYYPLLGLGISRELSKRVKLSQYSTVDDVVDLLKKSKNIVVLTGAGVSLVNRIGTITG